MKHDSMGGWVRHTLMALATALALAGTVNCVSAAEQDDKKTDKAAENTDKKGATADKDAKDSEQKSDSKKSGEKSPSISIELSNADAKNNDRPIKQAVIAGMGISFLSAHTIGRELERRQLAVLDVVGFPLQLQWYVVHLRQKVLAPVALAFKAFLLERGASLIGQVTGSAGVRPRRRRTAVDSVHNRPGGPR